MAGLKIWELAPGTKFRLSEGGTWYEIEKQDGVLTVSRDQHGMRHFLVSYHSAIEVLPPKHDTIPAPPPTPEEADPTGKDAHEPGAKLDAGKTWDYTVLRGFWSALREWLSPSHGGKVFKASCAMLGSDHATTAVGRLSPNDIIGAIRVGSYGAQKYTRYGWAHVPDAANRYREAFGRHFTKRYLLDEETDPDSGLPHEAHIAWNLLALATLEQPDFDPHELVQLDGKKDA